MSNPETLWPVESTLFKIFFGESFFLLIEEEDLNNFLSEIWLDSEDIYTCKILQKNNISNIDREKVKKYNDKVIDVFQNRKKIIANISKTNIFEVLREQLNEKLRVNKERLSEIIFEYIRYSLLSLVVNYEVQRISKSIFDIQKK